MSKSDTERRPRAQAEERGRWFISDKNKQQQSGRVTMNRQGALVALSELSWNGDVCPVHLLFFQTREEMTTGHRPAAVRKGTETDQAGSPSASLESGAKATLGAAQTSGS